ncbi:hypothetical protein O181_006202 [Austropuccinia psidii MF-1]|uniref:Uncharacterized protein n=1 Tax=Austropuccinia psidii MF-1 TaxID=1389203 RepID=A0A9Q3BKA4_9BASI|nr:hypothetical protein [Austropuccinia psidii MF-1]
MTSHQFSSHSFHSYISQGPRIRLGEAEDEEGEGSVGEEESEEAEVAASLAGAPEASESPNLALSNQPLVSQADPNFVKMMENMTQFMGQLAKEVAPRDNSRYPEFETPSMKAHDCFDVTQANKSRGFIQSCQLILHNNPEIFFSDRKKVLYSTLFLTGRDGKWIEPYLSNIYNKDPSYLLSNWKLFETKLFTLFSDPNEVGKDEQELDNIRMKESGHVSLRGLASRLLDELSSHPGSYDTLQELIKITLELDTRYHERKKGKGSHQEKKPCVTGSNSSMPPQDSSSKKSKKGKNFQALQDKPHSALLNKDNKLIGSEKERRIKEDSPKGEDLILGYDFLYHVNPIIDCKNRLITYHSSHKDLSGIDSSTSNEFATAVNSVALAGELKTPSFPSSDHIPSIMPSKSLLLSRDDIFKEIKDVGQDAAISSLHLFEGDIDLPPLSFHESLE